LNRAQLLKTVAEKTEMSKKDVEAVYDHAIRAIQDAVRKGERVGLTGFGNFTQKVRKGRKAGLVRNPFTGEMVKAAARPAQKLPKFTPAKLFKEYVSGAVKALPAVGGAKKAAPKKGAKKSAAKKKTAARKPAKKSAAKKRR